MHQGSARTDFSFCTADGPKPSSQGFRAKRTGKLGMTLVQICPIPRPSPSLVLWTGNGISISKVHTGTCVYTYQCPVRNKRLSDSAF